MDTTLVKKSVLNAFTGILNDLSVKELEDLQDLLTVKIFKLTDKGERISLENVKKELQILNDKK
ncbi:MAG TPA: hypothetical protein PK067_00725 [Kaistella chaponensis]|jgi:predicted transcriptional regulator|uniref:hypothetical protein n=1 Tax=Kaistella chaponensis TaxID=713588 RepID=UPI002BBD8359|nr:hypothetical protein [Kaistella chaponensis]HPW87692.1 hypothetical protein [Kaistella chaponensis]HQC05526.1 hypothetical protein [Kaistella chaponensis]